MALLNVQCYWDPQIIMIGYYIATIHTHLEQNTSPINNAYYGAPLLHAPYAMPYAPHDIVYNSNTYFCDAVLN